MCSGTNVFVYTIRKEYPKNDTYQSIINVYPLPIKPTPMIKQITHNTHGLMILHMNFFGVKSKLNWFKVSHIIIY